MSPEYSRAIITLRDRQLAAPPDPEVGGLAKRLGPLPREALFVGKFAGDGRYLLLFLHPDGRLLTYNVFFDETNEFAGATERDWGLRVGSGRYPELVAWITPRPAGATTCADCGGRGWVPGGPGETACPDCDGRGWREDRPPEP